MNEDPQKPGLSVEQSWIVLDDMGWVPGSRPSTASPSRPMARSTPFHREEDEDDEDIEPENQVRRLGMDRDVREALELAERSLELAGSVEEFFLHQGRMGPDDDGFYVRTSPSALVNRGGECDDKYNGRAPPVVRRSIGISTDSEHISFKSVKAEQPQQQFGENEDKRSVVEEKICEKPHEVDSQLSFIKTSRPSDPTDYSFDNEQDDEGGIFQWIFGLQVKASLLPLLVSHSLTLLAGLYFGYRRSSHLHQHSSSTSTTSAPPVTAVSGSQSS
jgi:hypothetical protein